MKRIITLALLVLCMLNVQAQCPLNNTAFQDGEKIGYELYFNWKFVWVKAGSAIFLTNKTVHKGQDAFRSYLITRTSKSLDNYFMMRDTLTGVFTTENVPLYYKKSAFEGKKYRKDEVWYDYSGGRVSLTQRYQNPAGQVTSQKHTSDDCIYDMMSLMQRARNMNVDDFKKGQKKYFKMADGDDIDDVFVIYKGKETISMKSGNTKYKCLVFSFMETEGGKDREIIRFFITDDANHLPVRLDMNLKFGSAKAYMISSSGLKNPNTAKTK